ncbi:MAG: hypothetical protein HY744_03045 [Deltaproteobacteria bacterium]|nr:hypothetical protein [Deltaproteobacteria bacterium]
MSNGGVTESQVHAIVRGYVEPVARQVGALEEEMGHVGRAVEHMSDRLAEGFNKLLGEGHSLRELTREIGVGTSAQLTSLRGESASGFASVTGGLAVVDAQVKQVDESVEETTSAVEQMTSAVVQMEVIRLLNEAKGPIERAKGFVQEIDQRFAKAIENVAFVQAQYDELLAKVTAEYDRKLRTIGEHIFRIYEQDFRERAEIPMTTPAEAHLDLALAVDERWLKARSDGLETNLAELGEAVLEPLLRAHAEFEDALAGQLACQAPVVQGELALPAAVRVVVEDGVERLQVVAGSRIEPVARPQADAAGPPFRFARAAAAEEIAALVERRAPAILEALGLATKALGPAGIEALKQELAKMAEQGLLEKTLLPGYADYLDAFGLEVVTDAEVTQR